MSTVLSIKGPLNFETVPDVWKRILPAFQQASVVDIDLSAVTECNSAALALLLEWIREAKKNRKKLKIVHMPERLGAIAAACGISKAFEVSL